MIGSHLEQKGAHLEKWDTLANWVTLKKKCTFKNWGHTWKHWSHVEKRVTLGRMGHCYKPGLHVQNWYKLGKMGRTYKNCFTHERISPTWKNESP